MSHFISKGHSSHVLRFIMDKVNETDDGDSPSVEDDITELVDAMEGRR